LEHVPVSKLCDELGLQPTVFYRWQKEFFENGAAAFGRQTRSDKAPELQRLASLERTLQRRNEILAELLDEHLALKTSLASR
jgi:transposase-like protein